MRPPFVIQRIVPQRGSSRKDYYVISELDDGRWAVINWFEWGQIQTKPSSMDHKSWLERVLGHDSEFRYWDSPRKYMHRGNKAKFEPDELDQNLKQWLSQGGKEEAARQTGAAEIAF